MATKQDRWGPFQRMAMVREGLDPNDMLNPRQQQPSLESQMERLEQMLADPRMKHRHARAKQRLREIKILRGEWTERPPWWRRWFGRMF